MAQYTENYNLEKPEANENYDIEVFNGNADIIDSALASKADLGEDGKIPGTQVPGYDTTESHIADTTKHVTAEDKQVWNGLDDYVRITVPTAGWAENTDETTAEAYPLKNVVTITSSLYDHPLWGIAGASDTALPTEDETDAFNSVKIMYAESTSLTFYTDETTAPATFYVMVQGVSV